MRKKFLMIWRRRPRLSRRGRVGVNLLVSVLAACLLWGAAGCPLPTAELEFRRMERTHLLLRSEIVFSNGEKSRDGLQMSRQDGSVFALDGTELYLQGRWMVGVQGDRAAVACLSESGRYIRSLPLGSDPALVPLMGRYGYLDCIGYWVTHGPGETPEGDPAYVYSYHDFIPFLLLNAPEGTASVEMTVLLEGEERSGGGWQLEDGAWMLGLEEDGSAGAGRLPGAAYTLRLYRADGSLLLEKGGTLPEE